MKRNVFKSIGVILLAFVINALLSIITDFLLESIGVLPHPEKGLFDTGAILLVLFYHCKAISRKPVLHSLIVGLIGVAITIIALNSPSFADKAPLWFCYTLAAITIPSLLLGVKIQENWNKRLV